MLDTGKEIVVPSGVPGGSPMIINLGAILASEIRQDEVAFVTPHKAPELLAEFNRSWRELHKMSTMLVNELNKAHKVLNRRKAVVLLEVAPEKLKQYKTTSADMRQAVLDLDPEYQAAEERVDQISCIIEYLHGKQKSFENAYSSTKKIMTDDSFNNRLGNNKNLDGQEGGAVGSTKAGWGKARF